MMVLEMSPDFQNEDEEGEEGDEDVSIIYYLVINFIW